MMVNPFFWTRYLYLLVQSLLEDAVGEKAASAVAFITTLSAAVIALALFVTITHSLATVIADCIRD